MKTLKPTWKISKKLILENFAFLQSEFDFPKFKKKWIKDEYYITTQKGGIEFNCLIFQFSWSSPEIGITNHSEPAEFNIDRMPTNYYRIDKLDKTGKLKKIAEKGNEFIEIYIKKCAELLKENPKILNGITTEFKTE
ncbi:hypothetical protein ACFQ1Q_02195 [Winogradskyella litorisediminis]|uniref:DUF4304 domain-containing protein n=1 Tax=Winogradskyella litorisediminis TaxID=1156618 RepID=A0ABW3N2U4_9FLAO